MMFKSVLAVGALSLAFAMAPAKAATVNVALLTEGATFVSSTTQLFSGGSPCCGGFINGGLTEAQNNLLKSTPTPWLANGDTRFIFADADPVQSIIIKLGSIYNLTQFGATFNSTDRVPGSVAVYTSLDGSVYTPAGLSSNPNAFTPGGSDSLILLGSPVQAQYVQYFFGQAIGANGAPNGAGVSELFAFASAVPEASTWAMMLLGFAGIGFAAYRQTKRNSAVLVAA